MTLSVVVIVYVHMLYMSTVLGGGTYRPVPDQVVQDGGPPVILFDPVDPEGVSLGPGGAL